MKNGRSRSKQQKNTSHFVPERFAEQVALVVGGAHGIGKAIAMRLALEGALVLVADMDRKALRVTANEIDPGARIWAYGIYSNALGPGFYSHSAVGMGSRSSGLCRKIRELDSAGEDGEPEDVAGLAAFLASRDSDYVNGVLLFVDGGRLA